jgi:hypothetical protein
MFWVHIHSRVYNLFESKSSITEIVVSSRVVFNKFKKKDMVFSLSNLVKITNATHTITLDSVYPL